MRVALEVLAVLVIGWVAGAETGSWCCVQPVVERLPYEHQVTIEQAMLHTFGRIMPVLMPLSGVLIVALVIASRGRGTEVFWLRVAAAACIAVATITTLTVNVPINAKTGSWHLGLDSADWNQMRAQWHFFQGVRAILFMVAFGTLAVAMGVTLVRC